MAVAGNYMVHNVETGFHRLMEAPKDIAEHALFSPDQIQRPEARDQYQSLFRHYEKDIGAAAEEAGDWWTALVDSHVEVAGGDFQKGLVQAYSGWPAGPSANDHIVSTVRSYWLSVSMLGESLEQKERVAPELFLLGWLPEGSEVRTILTGMPYWPIGMDKNGRWC